MSWKNALKGLPHPNRAWNRGDSWMVKDLIEARQFLKDVKVTYFTRKSAPTVKIPIHEASDSEVRTILAKLNVKIGREFNEAEDTGLVDAAGNRILRETGDGGLK